MISKILVLAALGTILVSCNTSKTDNNQGKVEQPQKVFTDDGHNPRNSLGWSGTYEGTILCADCEGIKTSVILNEDGTYSQIEEYLGKKGNPFEEEGKFEWNETGNVVTLTKKNGNQQYQVGESMLYQLDKNGNIIKENKYSLMKKNIVNAVENAELENKKWKLVNFMGKDINENADEYYITFNSNYKRMNTKVGCNGMRAIYELKNELSIKIGPVMSTMMACEEGSIENDYRNRLETVNNISINGEQLQLNSGRMTIATYKQVK